MCRKQFFRSCLLHTALSFTRKKKKKGGGWWRDDTSVGILVLKLDEEPVTNLAAMLLNQGSQPFIVIARSSCIALFGGGAHLKAT